ncbi:hypothetical protein C8A05DRAFT_18324, partial [Staphylotrichum tortipilum]
QSHTSCIEMGNFQLSTVKKLVQFIYTGDYDVPEDNQTAEAPQTHPHPTGDEGSGTQGHPLDMPPASPMSESSAASVLLEHIWVHSIGDYYQVDKLVSLANSKVKQLLQSHGKDEILAASLPTAIEEAIELMGNKELLEILAEAATVNISTLLDTVEFKSLSVMTDFSISMLQCCVQKNQALATELEKTKRQLCAVEDCLKAQNEQLRRERQSLQVLMGTSSCRNINCSAGFMCYIDPGECILRCATCRCKHYSVD